MKKIHSYFNPPLYIFSISEAYFFFISFPFSFIVSIILSIVKASAVRYTPFGISNPFRYIIIIKNQ